jgi:hypothetical protein
MATQVFLILSSLSVVFLVYVLVQLWREGRHSSTGTEPVLVLTRPSDPSLVVVTHPVSSSAYGGISVIPFVAPAAISLQAAVVGNTKAQVLQMPERKRSGDARLAAKNPRTKAR